MAHALLVADQHVTEGLLGSTSSKLFDRLSSRLQSSQSYDARGFIQLGEGQVATIELNQPPDEPLTTVESHLLRAQNTLKHLAQYEQRAGRYEQFRQEMNWLAANKRRFAGRWIALEGYDLLAVGDTSREVFSQLPAHATPPLVIRINEEDLPFAGW